MSIRLLCFLAVCASVPCGIFAQDGLPVISNIRYVNDIGEKVVTIQYDVSDAESSELEILFKASFDEGGHFLVNTATASGDVGPSVQAGTDRSITWHYGDFWDDIEGKTLRIVADDGFRPDLNELVSQVDEDRMRQMLEYISQPRSFQVNTGHLFDLRDSLISLVGHYGYELILQEFQHRGRTATNVIGRRAGLGSEDSTYIMDAHYDANIDAPGADDNGSGVVGFLEAMRILAPYQFDKSIEFIGFDQEEEGLLGSINYAWLGGIEPWKRVEGVLNYEMIGYYTERPFTQQVPFGFDLLFEEEYQDLVDNEFRGDFIFITGNEVSVDVVRAFKDAAEDYVPGLKVVSAVVPLNGLIAPDLLRSDHAPFWFKGIPAIMITDGSEFRNRNYHTPTDVLDSLDMGFMKQVTQAGLAALVDLAGIRHAAVETFTVNTVITSDEDREPSGCALQVYPNPASERVLIDMTGCSLSRDGMRIVLRDIAGKVVDEYPGQDLSAGSFGIDVSHLECGTYIIQVLSGEGSASKQIIVH